MLPEESGLIRRYLVYKNKKQGTPKLGGMWEKQTQKGTIFSISINAEQLPEPDENGRIRLTALTNNYKEQETHPDYNLLVATPKEQFRGNKGGGGFKGRPAQRPAPGKFQKRAPVQQEVSEDSDGGDETEDSDDESGVPF
jgi:hypothetical protein